MLKRYPLIMVVFLLAILYVLPLHSQDNPSITQESQSDSIFVQENRPLSNALAKQESAAGDVKDPVIKDNTIDLSIHPGETLTKTSVYIGSGRFEPYYVVDIKEKPSYISYSTDRVYRSYSNYNPVGTQRVDFTIKAQASAPTGNFRVVVDYKFHYGAGSYTTLTLTINGSVIDTEPPPVADFSGSPRTGNTPLTVNFTDNSSGSITSRSWDFGDGSSSTSTSPSHTYSNVGNYTVKLTVTGPGGSNTKTRTDYITVTAPSLVADFSGTPLSGQAPLEVQFTNNSSGEINGYYWDFGDGTTSTRSNPKHVFESAGSFRINLTVMGPGGNDTKIKDDYIIVTEAAPVADFSGSPRSGNAPFAVTFTDNSSGSITSRLWDFGDGSTSTSTNPSHTYSNTGTFTVKLTVTGPGGSNTKTRSGYISVTNAAPAADFSGSPLSGNAPLAVTFTDNSSGSITSRLWDFGDGSTSTLTNPRHTYSNTGTFTVKLTVTGPGGSNTKTRSGYVSVTNAGPVADFSGSPTSGSAPLTVTFTDNSSGSITSRLWDFGDGSTSTSTNPNHTYSSNGIYTVKLTITGPGGSHTETKQNYINVGDQSSDMGGTYEDVHITYSFYIAGGAVRIDAWAYKDWTIIQNGSSIEVNGYSGTIDANNHFSVEGRLVGESGGTQNYSGTFDPNQNRISGTFTGTVARIGTDGLKYIDTISNGAFSGIKSSDLNADFIADKTSGAPPLEVYFTDKSTGDITSYLWEFGDGQTSTEKNPTHTFQSTGIFTIKLTVTGPAGSKTKTRTNYITVTNPIIPVANFVGSPTTGSSPLTVQFSDLSTGTITSRLWDFGDGQSSTEKNPSHTFQTEGSYTVRLVVTGPGGTRTKVRTDYIIVSNTAPNMIQNPEFNQEMANWYTYVDPRDAQYYLSIDRTSILSGVNSLKVDVRKSGTVDWYITVHTMNMAIQKNEYYKIQFKAKLIGAKSKRYRMSFQQSGDPWTTYGELTSSLNDSTENYGPFYIKANTTDSYARFNFFFGDEAMSNFFIYLDQVSVSRCEYIEPEAKFTVTPVSGNAPLEVSFNNESTGLINSRQWIFGDGGKSYERNPTHIYEEDGTYDVTLLIWDANGKRAQLKMEGCVTVGTTAVENENNGYLVDNYSLMQNYPNPFNPVTSISFTLPSSEHVTLTVFNAIGEVMDVLVNGNMSAGEHRVQWDASQMVAGVYFYHIQAGAFSDVKKSVLMK